MSKELDDGGPAFPCEGGEQSGLYADPGMSLRDWFAGMALQGHLANPTTTNNPGYTRESLVGECYHMADAMLKARDSKKSA
jgi:hypothetical protein